MGRWTCRRPDMAPVPVPAATPAVRADPAEAQAFADQARWLHAYHERRSETIGTRAAALLGFVAAAVALLPAGCTLAGDAVAFTDKVKANVVAVLVLLVLAAGMSLRVIAVRKSSVPNGKQLRDQWHRYATGGTRGLVHAQIAHTFLGGAPDRDPIALASKEADSRARAFKWALRFAGTAVLATATLTGQILYQQV